MSKPVPSIDAWLREAKAHESAPKIGMYLTHNGTVRQTAKAKVRYGAEDTKEVIDITELNNQIEEIVARENVLREEISKIIAEIGV